MAQNQLITIVPILDKKCDILSDHLRSIRIELLKGVKPDFEAFNSIHFARWVIIDREIPGFPTPTSAIPKLCFVVDYDGTQAELFKNLSTVSSAMIDGIYCYCEDYPLENKRTEESRIAFFNRHTIKNTSVYIGAPGRSLQQIRDESRLRNYLRDYLDFLSLKRGPAKEIHEKLRTKIMSENDFEFLKTPVKMPKINWFGMALIGLILLVLSPLLILWILMVQFFYERKDEVFTMKRSQLDNQALSTLETYEDIYNQNQFTQLVEMKPGIVRLITINGMFMLANGLIRFFFVKGKLMGIPSIHFARWVLFDDNKRVLFFSNFDGSWQQYLGDFIDKSGWGLTGIFSNTKVFPKTKFLLTGGAYDEEHFLAWSRHSQLPTDVWYSAYPQLSIKNINNNTKIRTLLMKDLSEKQAAKFLQLL
ncbi:hypothetical protein SAMN00777080_3678 [Aquiflexum balticum DSM 16537]|uniref:Uncharacterized protein n=1 Tax=Aquiflexum balticum DSM 16537 TaxID=758820 RepID=A0A1W2H7Z6_9BACT|nr:hypothetical protein [Aquiflexum balticum]SMD45037.1 hypothetical protein SAMN00777080_3678 [Aquiflexum balticum DSM 16537]